MAHICIIDYGSGNLHSALKAFEHVAPNDTVKLVTSANELNDATHIVLPGVGAFGDCLAGLNAVDGMIEKLIELVITQERWFLGICVGMQLLAKTGLENGTHDGLGWIDGTVKAIEPNDPSLKIPHMGWNNLTLNSDHPLFKNIDDDAHAYFVHSYHMEVANNDVVIATTNYGSTVTAAVAEDNIMGTQFHPEKSQEVGLKLIQNFVGL